ncbi:MAG: hypothetical protein WCO55_01270 [Candidatus Falkowbacteria bacterium]
MANVIYGVDIDAPFTASQTREALVDCLCLAHTEDAELGADTSDTARSYCADLVEKAFEETGGDFQAPTKESILKALAYLAEFAKNFRNPEIVKSHVAQVMRIIDKLPAKE